MTNPRRVSNYFKCARNQFFPFEDHLLESVQAAYESALKEDPNPAVYRPTMRPGPWDSAPIIGHRSRAAIFADIANSADNDEEVDRLHNELAALSTVFLNSGRTIPLQAVA